MSDEMKPPKPSEILEVALKASAAVVGVLYATGLIVASLRLAQLGIVSTEFVKPLYVLTGVWAWLPIAIALAPWFTYRETLKFSGQGFAAFMAIAVAVVLVMVVCFIVPKIANNYFHLMGCRERFALSFFFLLAMPFAVGLFFMMFTPKSQQVTPIAFALSAAGGLVLGGTVYLLVFTFWVYVKIPVQLGGGAPRTFALVINEPKIRQTITGDVDAKSPIITPVITETAGNYILPAPKVRLEEFSLNPELSRADDWGAEKVFEHSFVIVPKQTVSVATIVGGSAEPKDYKRIKQEIQNRAGDRDKMNSLGSPSMTPKR